MVASYEVHTLGVLNFEGQQEAHGLQRVGSSIYVVSEEEVVYVGDVSSSAGSAILFEQSHKVQELAMQVSKNFYWRCRHSRAFVKLFSSWAGVQKKSCDLSQRGAVHRIAPCHIAFSLLVIGMQEANIRLAFCHLCDSWERM